MGGACVRSITPDEENSRKIDQELKQENQIKREKAVTILLLGPGESGKSTILKQMKILSKGHDGGGFTDEDRLMYRATIKKTCYTKYARLNKRCWPFKVRNN